MEIKKENLTDSLNIKKKINKSEDLREHKSDIYNAIQDLNKTTININESKPIETIGLYDVNELLIENK